MQFITGFMADVINVDIQDCKTSTFRKLVLSNDI